jgi:putative CocE/NonD family hydrolase
MEEPPVRFWVMGLNEWRSADDWPLPQTQWTKFYLKGWERLTADLPAPSSASEVQPADAFAQMPPSQTNTIQRLRYMTEPLPRDVLIAGPIAVTLYAAIDQDDTNWIVILKDLGPDVSVQSVREGEREVPKNLAERELTRGWLKASHRGLDPKRSKPWWPWHPLTRQACKPVTPGAIEEYQIEVMATANLFRKGHRICLDITSLDLPTGVAGATNAEYVPYHICSSKTVLHKVHHDRAHPSHLLLPIIPQ